MSIQRAKVTPDLPANYDEELAAESLAMVKRIGAPSGDLIRVNKDKTFSLPSGETSPTLGVVVLSFASMFQYYEGRYDEKNIQPPSCMALGTDLSLMKPFDKVPKKQNADCPTCWANQWGTDGKGKACKNQRLLALLAPAAQKDGVIMTLKVSPTGTRYWDNYVTQVMAMTESLIKVVTEISFDPSVDYASLRFKLIRPNEDWKDAFPRRGPALERLLTEPEFTPANVQPKPGEKHGKSA
jgi:hypothetical protein